ncbi:MAG: peptidylprolyl isomerase [Xanthomonadales bacterium]|nr:peptidylprolyl isomerase [Xanthomonadales bacterium]
MARLALVAWLLALPGAVLAQPEMTWREVNPDALVYMELGEGQVIIELAPRFAPETVEQFKRLVQEDFYRGLSFYRVIDGFVAQAGDESDINLPNPEPALPAEFEIERDDELPWVTVEKDDLYEAETGFVNGFAAARDQDHVWLTHCPGAVAMARNNEPDSGSTDFYIVIGQAPRYLDRNLAIFGRVVHGMDVVQRIRRGRTEDNGVIASDTERSRISRMRLGSELPEQERQQVFVMDTGGRGFKAFMDSRRNRKHEFFHHKPPKVLDVCQVPIATRIEKAPSPELGITVSPEAAPEG